MEYLNYLKIPAAVGAANAAASAISPQTGQPYFNDIFVQLTSSNVLIGPDQNWQRYGLSYAIGALLPSALAVAGAEYFMGKSISAKEIAVVAGLTSAAFGVLTWQQLDQSVLAAMGKSPGYTLQNTATNGTPVAYEMAAVGVMTAACAMGAVVAGSLLLNL